MVKNYILYIVIIYSVILFYFLDSNKDLNTPLSTQLTFLFTNFLFFILIGYVAFHYVRRFNADYRWRTAGIIMMLFLSVSVRGLIQGYLYRYNFEHPGVLDFTFITWAIDIPLYLIVVLIMNEMIKLTRPFSTELSRVADEFNRGNIEAQITDEHLLLDSVFGPMSAFCNSIMQTASKLINELSDMISLLSSTSEELASNTEEINASAEEVSATSQSMSRGAAEQSSQMTVVLDKLHSIQEIVSEIIYHIESNTNNVSQIALQTNILALNAGIEASRAGDYGRGFAVVAENIRKLSDQSKISSEQINEVVGTISHALTDAFGDIKNSVESVAAVSEETAASAQEVAAAAEEMTASMEEVSALAMKLAEQAMKSTKLT